MYGLHVGQSDGVGHLLRHTNLLARAVDEPELAVGEEYGQGDAGEASACAEVEDAGGRLEAAHLADGQRVEHMVGVEIVDVLT